MKQSIVVGSLGVAMVALGLGFAPPSNAQGVMDGLTGLLGAQAQTSTTEPTAIPSPNTLPGGYSGGEEGSVEDIPTGSELDTGMATTPDTGTPQGATGSSSESPEEGMAPQPLPAMPVQPGF
jgi:hypothetical protein